MVKIDQYSITYRNGSEIRTFLNVTDGANPVGAAIASAIDDAIGRPGAVTRLPVSPQRLKALMAET